MMASSEETALAELYDRFGRVAWGLAVRVLRDEELAEDAVQEAFLTAWRTCSRFVPDRASARTWLLTLVHRRAVDLVRRQERRKAEPLEGSPDVLLIVRADSASEIAGRLAGDPRTRNGLLVVTQIRPWQLRLGALP